MWFSETVREGLEISHAILNFLPSWWHGRFGIEYGPKMVFDPDYRVGTFLAMRSAFFDCFGKDMGAGSPDPMPRALAPDWENTSTQALLGFEIHYPIDRYPECSTHLGTERLEELEVPEDLLQRFPNTEILRQMEHLNRKFGTEEPAFVPMRGVLNEALIVRGEAVLADLLEEDAAQAEKVMDFSFGLLSKQIMLNRERGCREYVMMNCSSELVGPEFYARHVLPYDQGIAALCRRLGVKLSLHHCGNIDGFLDSYGTLGPLATIEIGSRSDPRKTLERFPDSRIQCIVDTVSMRCMNPSQVEDEARKLLESTEGHHERMSVNMADIEKDMPDENLLVYVEALKR